MTPSTWTLNIPGWSPALLNTFGDGQHWAVRQRAKAKDSSILAHAKLAHGVTDADCKRRLEVLLIHPKGKRFPDKDALAKCLHDCLVRCGMLKNDSHVWLDAEKPEYARGDTLRTIITLTNV